MSFGKIFLVSALFVFFAQFAVPSEASAQASENQSTREENFKLNITTKKISEENYRADVEVGAETPTNPSVSVNVGVGVRAKRITATLINITGDVKFRGSLEKILDRLNLTRETKTNQSN